MELDGSVHFTTCSNRSASFQFHSMYTQLKNTYTPKGVNVQKSYPVKLRG